MPVQYFSEITYLDMASTLAPILLLKDLRKIETDLMGSLLGRLKIETSLPEIEILAGMYRFVAGHFQTKGFTPNRHFTNIAKKET